MARANVVNTRIVSTESTLSPYFNDFDESKNYHQMLFRPGFAVQGRELTQLQSILQNQVERFGQHIFENGSSVVGGDASFMTDMVTLNVNSTYDSTTVDITEFKDKTIRYADANNDVIARVLQTSSATDDSPAAIHLRYETGEEFPAGSTIKIEGEETYANLVSTANVSTNCTIGFVYDSIYFYDGYFVKVPQQTVVLDSFTSQANVKMGLESDESIITSSEDTSLLDPALGASNYQAPGADRYKKELVLAKRDLDSVDDTKFIEILRLDNGEIADKVAVPLYSEIEEVLARRTYDESGSYTVKPFSARNVESQIDPTNNVAIELMPGKAYVKGFEYETKNKTVLQVPRARTIANTFNYDLNLNYGNYVIVDGLEGVFDIENQEVIDLHSSVYTDIDFTSQGNYDTTKIGTVRLRDVEFFGGEAVAADRKHEISFFDSKFTGASSFAAANSFVKHSSYTPGASSDANANITTLNFDDATVSGNATVTESGKLSLVWRFPESYIKESSMTNASYQYRKMYTGVSFTAGVSAAITAPSDQQFIGDSSTSNVATTVTDNFLVVVTAAGASARGVGDQVVVNAAVSGDPEQVVFDTATGGTDTFTATILAKMEVDGTSAGARVKTLSKANTQTFASEAAANTFINGTGSTTNIYLDTGQVTISSPSRTPGVKESLFISDVIGIKSIYDLNGASIPAGGADITGYTDVSAKYDFDTGQKDAYYDHASISLKPGQYPAAGPLIVCTRYYKTTSDEGYFSVDSYPSLTTDITEEGVSLGTGYSIIPSFETNQDIKFNLRDSVDFRPVRTNASNTSINYTLEGSRVPITKTDFEADYAYYLGRRDLIVLKPNKNIERIQGIPGVYPQDPRPPTDAMVLHSVNVLPYTTSPAAAEIQMVDNRRYTMRDIGLIDKRLQNVEYYTTLNSLEKSAVDISVLDVNGLERTKYGVLADSFTDFGLSDVLAQDSQFALELRTGYMHHKSNTYSHQLAVDSSSINNIKVNEDKILLDYTEQEFINQNTATKFTAVAEYLFSDFKGTILMDPDSDFWQSTNTTPIWDPPWAENTNNDDPPGRNIIADGDRRGRRLNIDEPSRRRRRRRRDDDDDRNRWRRD